MKILFVTPAAQMSISDVGRGYRMALERQGHEIRDYNMVARLQYHERAIPEEAKADPRTVIRQASENILNEALYSEVDLVLVISGLNVHPVALWSLAKVGIPVVVVLTESPYDDEQQKQWADMTKFGKKSPLLFTNDAWSAKQWGWHFLPPAFDPSVHFPVDAVEDCKSDVIMIGTGWDERQTFMEAVNWSGIDLKIYGVWPEIRAESPLFKYLSPVLINNTAINKYYCSAKICLNFHRRHQMAITPNPRAYEIAACGAFQLSDPRPGLADLFGDRVFTFDTPAALEKAVRFYLQESAARMKMASECRTLVQAHTFDVRAKELMEIVGRELPVPAEAAP